MGNIPELGLGSCKAALLLLGFHTGKEIDMPIRTRRAKSGMKRIFKQDAKATAGPLNRLGRPELRQGLRPLQTSLAGKKPSKPTRGLRFNKSGRRTRVVV